MSNYQHPYCTIDKLRISKANGIRFLYLTDSEGSFFDGENIPDNTPYNDIENCGFVVPPFQQQIPCGGIARFQFQWCDDLKPYVHVFKNGEFDYELTPSLISDGQYQIYEQELNFDESFCNSCVEIKICTKEQNWFSVFVEGSGNNIYYGSDSSYTSIPIEVGYGVRNISVFAQKKAMLIAIDAYTKIYSLIDGVLNLIDTRSDIDGDYIKAFDENNWIIVNSGGSNKALVCKNGVITLETTTISTWFYGIDGFSIDEIYGLSQTFMSTAKIVKRDENGVWSPIIDFGGNPISINGNPSLSLVNRNCYVSFVQTGILKQGSINVDTNNADYVNIAVDSTSNSIDYLDSNNAICSSLTKLYIYSNGIWSLDNDFDNIRTSRSDSSNIASISYQGIGLIMVNTAERLYAKVEGVWTDQIGTNPPYGETFILNDGIYTLNYVYHAKSEPIIIADDECLKKIEYWNIDDYDYQTFCQGFRNITYIQCQITGFKPLEETEVYITSNNRKRVISSNLAKINTLDINYIPEYLHEILMRAFGMNYLELDGKSYTKEGDYNITENPSLYALWKANVELYENLYKFANSNCDESC